VTPGVGPHLVVPVCVNHPKRETGVRCSKCGDPLCTRCMVQTPVGMRCRACANLRRLPQYEIPALLLVRATAGGLISSFLAWSIVSYVAYLRFFLSIFVGLAVAAVMSSQAKQRDNRALEIAAAANVVLGFFAAEIVVLQIPFADLLAGATSSPAFMLSLGIPIAIACTVAVVKLR